MIKHSEFINLLAANDNPGGATTAQFPLAGMITIIARAFVTAHVSEYAAAETSHAANSANPPQTSRISSLNLVDVTEDDKSIGDTCDVSPEPRRAPSVDTQAQIG